MPYPKNLSKKQEDTALLHRNHKKKFLNFFVLLMPCFLFFGEGFSLRPLPSLQPTYREQRKVTAETQRNLLSGSFESEKTFAFSASLR